MELKLGLVKMEKVVLIVIFPFANLITKYLQVFR